MNTIQNGTERLTWFEPGTALQRIRQQALLAQKEIRIATGFFTIKGWDKIRNSIQGKRIYLLVGIDEPGEERAYDFVVKELMRDLRTGLHRERRQAVIDLVKRMQNEDLQIVDARAKDHHSKNYLFDRQAAIITSANLTGRGLSERIESGGIHTQQEEVNYLVDQFERYFAEAEDITQELLKILLQWLEFVNPWDIYLKTMLLLEQLPEVESKYSKHPSAYQVDMIAQTLRHLRQHRGSMLVASTGLGKTVVAIHVGLRLKQAHEIDNIMVVGLAGNIQTNWEEHLDEAGLPYKYVSMKALDQQNNEPVRVFERVAELIGKDERQWLIVIDESHQLRNRYMQAFPWVQKNREREAFKRLKQVCHSSHAKVLLLTASPLAKSEDNLNNQLYLLPHTASLQTLFEDYMEDEARPWTAATVENFTNLPVVSQLTTPHVARYYGQQEEKEIYVKRGEDKVYIPHLILRSVTFPLLLQEEVSNILEDKYLRLKGKNNVTTSNIERQAKIAWSSSPLALLGIFNKVYNTPGQIDAYPSANFLFKKEERQLALEPVIKLLQFYTNSNFAYENDNKFRTLLSLIEDLKAQKRKIIVFCERRATVAYLAKQLSELMPQLRVAATISESENNYEMKDSNEIETLIKQFAPVANDYECPNSEQYDIFICTDAQGVGINMQDSSAVINYDIAWTPIDPIQRAGRILRFCPEPRTIEVITFIPTLDKQTSLKYELLHTISRWQRLMERHGKSRQLIQMPVLTEDMVQEVDMLDVPSGVKIQSTQLDLLEDLAKADASPSFQHLANLQNHRKYAESIPRDIMSALTTDKIESPYLYVLLTYQGEIHGLFYNPQTQKVIEPTPLEIWHKIACPQSTEPAIVNPELVENLSDACIQTWIERNRANPDEVLRECTLYLIPKSEENSAKDWFERK